MDPNATLADILEALRAIDAENSEYEHDSDAGDIRSPSQVADHYDTIDELCDGLADRVQALHDWLSGGGFLPDAWNANRAPAATATEYGTRYVDTDGQTVTEPYVGDLDAARAHVARFSDMWRSAPAHVVQRSVSYGEWIDVNAGVTQS